MRAGQLQNRVLLGAGAACLILAFAIVAYYFAAVPVEKTFGERYVTPEMPLIFPFFVIMSFKPVTVITYLGFAGAVLILEASKDSLRKLETRGVRILLTLVAFASGYEVLWNFFAWFTVWQIKGGQLDLVSNLTHEYSLMPANFNFATKIIFLTFSVTLYASLLLKNLETEREYQNYR